MPTALAADAWTMDLSTLDQQGCAGLPPEHSVEAHLELERAAIAAERRAAVQRAAKGDRWMLVRAAGLGLALAGTIAFGFSRLNPDEPAPTCPAADASAASDAAGCR